MPSQFPTIFLSSTKRDLEQHRKKIIETLIKAKIFPLAMEFFGADDAPPLKLCLKVLDKADACILIVGNSYGSRPPGRRRSYTWLEYLHAKKRPIPLRVFVMANLNANLSISSGSDEDAVALERFKRDLQKHHTVEFFDSPDDLGVKVSDALHSIVEQIPSTTVLVDDQVETLRDLEDSLHRTSVSLATWRQTLVNDEWIERPELTLIQHRIACADATSTVLLGPPGSGKSALLARVCTSAMDSGMIVIGIKADQLPLHINSIEDLSNYTNIPIRLDKAIALLAAEKPILLLIDQLDALADLMDLRSGRLNAVLQLIACCHGLPRVHLVCSCRELEFRRDARLSSLEAEQCPLTLPPWKRIQQTLVAAGISGADQWSENFRAILQTPQYLDVFLRRHLETGLTSVFDSYQAMLDEMWERKVNTPQKRVLIDLFTEFSMDQETHWAPRVRFENLSETVNELIYDGIFVERERQIGFRHQTMLEHARARHFTKTGVSLADYVRDRQVGLFVRPTVWSTLTYLRAADTQSYERTIAGMFAEKVRLHLRHLLIDFLGMQACPYEHEVLHMEGRLTVLDDRKRVLAAIRGQAAWFRAFHKTHLPTVARWPVEELWNLIPIIEEAFHFAREECLEFIDKHLLPDPQKDELTWRCLHVLPDWDDKAVGRIQTLIRRAPAGRLWWGEDFAYVISDQQPDLAPKVVSTLLWREIEQGDTKTIGESESRRSISSNPLESANSWYKLAAVADASPIEFLRELWPWFLEVAKLYYDSSTSTVLNEFRGRSPIFDRDVRWNHSRPILESIEAATLKCASLSAADFLTITRASWAIDSEMVQIMLARGLAEAAHREPAMGLEFLSTDSRRLALGCFSRGDEFYSCHLITALCDHLSDNRIRDLERLICNWSQYRPKAELCSDQFEWDREARLRLLLAIPEGKRSAELNTFIESEVGELPNAMRVRRRIGGGFIQRLSPMSKEEMRVAGDDELVKALTTPPADDRPRWYDNPDGELIEPGGCDEACQVLCELAKEDPARGASYVSMLIGRGVIGPVGRVLPVLADTDLSDEIALGLIPADGSSEPFSESFRSDAACLLYKRCRTGIGLPEKLCETLERWLYQDWSPRDGDSTSDNDEKNVQSILWGYRDGIINSDDSFWVFEALTFGLLLQRLPKYSDWLSALEKHLDLHPSPKAWRSYCSDLKWITSKACDRVRSTSLIDRLFAKMPSVRDSEEGVRLIDEVARTLPPLLLQSFIRHITDGDWPKKHQALGELLTSISFDTPQHSWARVELETRLNQINMTAAEDEAFATGVAYAAAQLWEEFDHRHEACQLLTKLIPVATPKVAAAIATVFWASEDFPADEHTEELIEALAKHPQILVEYAVSDFLPHLVTLVLHKRESVLRVCQAIVAARGRDLGNIATDLYNCGGPLVSISMTLQRFPETRLGALELFEELLRLGVGDAFECLNEIDLRPTAVSRREPHQRRRRQR